MNKVTDRSLYTVGWPAVVYTSSWGQVTFLTTIEFAVLTLPDFKGHLFLGRSLIAASESDLSSKVLMVRIQCRFSVHYPDHHVPHFFGQFSSGCLDVCMVVELS